MNPRSYLFKNADKWGVIHLGQAAAAERPEISLALEYAKAAKIQTAQYWDAEQHRFVEFGKATK